MEIELKYSIPDPDVIDRMWRDEVFRKYGDIDIDTEVQMQAVYYDTADGDLREEKAAFRIRMENGQAVATLKWNDSQKEGLFEREELNIMLKGDRCRVPSLEPFAESPSAGRLRDKVGDKPLVEVLRTDFLRREKRIDTGSVIFEADLDVGQIITSKGTLEICELELEHYSGSIEEMRRIGQSLASQFGLSLGVTSKYRRGIDLLEAADE